MNFEVGDMVKVIHDIYHPCYQCTGVIINTSKWFMSRNNGWDIDYFWDVWFIEGHEKFCVCEEDLELLRS